MKKLFYSIIIVATFVATIVFFSCNKDSNIYLTGRISGNVYAKNGKTLLGAVKVYLQDNPSINTLTNKNGYFILSAPLGIHKLVIQTGNGNLFKTIITVNVIENKTIFLAPQLTILNQVGNLAYIKGVYDRIETIIIDSLGYSATQIQISTLDSSNKLASYHAIFLNCGKYGTLDSNKYKNLKTFVSNCGSIYASD